jgi:hypothetical protein
MVLVGTGAVGIIEGIALDVLQLAAGSFHPSIVFAGAAILSLCIYMALKVWARPSVRPSADLE